MVGLGGITTELFRDVIYRPAPVSAAEAAAMLGELKAAPLLNGFRGAREGRYCGAVAVDRAGLGAGRAMHARDCRDRTQSGAGASGRAGRDDRRCAGGGEEVASSAALYPLPLAGEGGVAKRELARVASAEKPPPASLREAPSPQAGEEDSPPLEIRHAAFGGGLDAFLEIFGRAQPCSARPVRGWSRPARGRRGRRAWWRGSRSGRAASIRRSRRRASWPRRAPGPAARRHWRGPSWWLPRR